MGLLTLAAGRGRGDTTPPVAGFAFASDFGFNTGSTDTIVRDNNEWDVYNNYSSANLLSIVASTGLDFPSDNVLRVDFNNESSGDIRIWDKWALPAGTGNGLYHRVYFRNAIADGAGSHGTGAVHQIEPWSGGGVPWAFKFGTQNDGTTPVIYSFPGLSNWNGPTLSKNTTYRIEWAFIRKGNGFFTPLVRIYNSSDTLLYDTDDFVDDALNTLTAADPDVDLSQADDGTPPTSIFGRELFIGNNGPVNWTVGPGNYNYFGCVAVSTTDWCGAYTVGEAD